MEWTRINLDASPSAAPTIEVSDGAPASLWCNPPRAAGTSASHTNEVRVVEWSAFSKQMTYLGEGEVCARPNPLPLPCIVILLGIAF